jgi:hypothetical protein
MTGGKNKTFFVALFFAATITIYFSCNKKEYKNSDCSQHSHTYAATIKPIIDNSCALSGCHGTASSNGDFTSFAGVKASVEMDKFGDAVLFKQNMPPSGPLSLEERQRIKCWIDEGAKND